MGMLTHARARRRGDRGAALVEMALVAPLLIMLVLGIVDFSTLFSEKIDLRGGVREASWNAGRGIYGSTVPCALSFTQAPPPNAETRQVMCLVKARSGLDGSDLRVMVRLVNLGPVGQPATYEVGQGLMVCAMRTPQSVTHFFSSLFAGKTQKSRLSTVILRTSGTLVTASEDHLPDLDWTFCDPNVNVPE
jgi:hypothetical protein